MSKGYALIAYKAASQEKGSKQAWFPLSKHSSRESLGDGEAAEVLDSDSCSIRPAPPRKVRQASFPASSLLCSPLLFLAE